MGEGRRGWGGGGVGDAETGGVMVVVTAGTAAANGQGVPAAVRQAPRLEREGRGSMGLCTHSGELISLVSSDSRRSSFSRSRGRESAFFRISRDDISCAACEPALGIADSFLSAQPKERYSYLHVLLAGWSWIL